MGFIPPNFTVFILRFFNSPQSSGVIFFLSCIYASFVATKEAYMHDRKKMTPELCGELKNLRMNTVKLGGIKPTDMKMTLVTSIASSPR